MNREFTGEESYRGLPQLAGLCPMARATEGDWSLEQSVTRLKRLHFVLRRLHEMFTARITSEPIYELKTTFSYHAYLCAEQVDLIRRRVGEMREPPLGLDKVPHEGLRRCMDDLYAAETTESFLAGVYLVVLPEILDACRRLHEDAHPLADAPTARVARLIRFELTDVASVGAGCCRALQEEMAKREEAEVDFGGPQWGDHLRRCLDSAGGLDGGSVEAQGEDHGDAGEPGVGLPPVPDPWPFTSRWVFRGEPRRDGRFIDSFNAGVNAEAFLYDHRFSARDKTLMMYYKRIREIDVPEMMASILVDLIDEEPWGFHMEMSRQLWDEARHAMMGEVGFVAQGIDWRNVPINFTWSRNLNSQLTARERHGVLFFIEQGLMPRNGKRYEWEVATDSGDRLARLFQDFDWADEVLHAQIGRRHYVPKFESLNESMDYGDRCWSTVLSHWREDRDQGRTQHRNWWPDLYRDACQKWGRTPDPEALAFCETYETNRADLRSIHE